MDEELDVRFEELPWQKEEYGEDLDILDVEDKLVKVGQAAVAATTTFSDAAHRLAEGLSRRRKQRSAKPEPDGKRKGGLSTQEKANKMRQARKAKRRRSK